MAQFVGSKSKTLHETGKVLGLNRIVEGHKRDLTSVEELEGELRANSDQLLQIARSQEHLIERLISATVRTQMGASPINTLDAHRCYSETQASVTRPQLNPLVLRKCTSLCHLNEAQHNRILKINRIRERLIR